MTTAGLIIRYAGFAGIATLCNLGAQRAVFAVLPDGTARLVAALILGTGVGLVVKYLLDKRWIFFDRARALGTQARRFSLYTLTGVGTTALFWGAESLFWAIWETRQMREVGAILGLTAGYVIKYQLDKRFVFRGGEAPSHRQQHQPRP